MRDPLLTRVGVNESVETGKRIDEWLDAKGPDWSLDGVLSSTLVRAMETAAYTFPGYKIEVVPFIEEVGAGHDNLPREPSEQIEKLGEHLDGDLADWVMKPPGVQIDLIDFHWVAGASDLAGKPSWESFRNFLANAYLPNLLAQRRAAGVPEDKPVVLAVVTHSNFMTQGEVQERCGDKFPTADGKPGSHGEHADEEPPQRRVRFHIPGLGGNKTKVQRKPNNNQAVLLSYKLVDKFQRETRSLNFVEGMLGYTLEPQGECQAVVPGMTRTDASGEMRRMCATDVGWDGLEYIRAKTFRPFTTLDDDLKAAHDEVLSEIKDIQNSFGRKAFKLPAMFGKHKNTELAPRLRRLKDARDKFYHLKDSIQCWTEGKPEDPELPTNRWSYSDEESDSSLDLHIRSLLKELGISALELLPTP